MKISDLLSEGSINLNAASANKQEALELIIDLMDKSGKISDIRVYKQGVFKREEEGTTGIGDGVAIPHCKSSAVRETGLAAMVVKDGVDYGSPDGKPVHLLFLIAAPDTDSNEHLTVLSRLSVLLMDEKFTGDLINAKTPKEFLSIIDAAEKKRMQRDQPKDAPYIVAVTGCPTGIAHTYMAAESLEKKAEDLGVKIKVETRGSGGAKNVLTKEEIDTAICIIVAADTTVPMQRFNGKRLIKCGVSDGIHKAEELIKSAMEGDAKIYISGDRSGSDDTSENTDYDGAQVGESGSGSGGIHGIYTHLMSGVSHMLPFVVGGGILIAIAFLLDDYSIDPANFGMNTPVAAWFKTIGNTAFGFMLPILAGYIAMSIADRPGLAVGFVGGALASAGSTFANPAGDVSAGFLGALFAGFAGGYIVVGLKKLCGKLPDALEGIKPVLVYPLIGILLVSVLMCIVNPFVALINTGLTNGLSSMGNRNMIILGALLGGMMSIDMGGPFNKAAYVFGTGMLAEQTEAGFMIMAAVMVGGMIPPLVIALSTTLFKNKYSSKDRKAGVINYIMGLCFISEGAIPYAAADPLRVIPSCILGSAIAGGLSMMFQCTLRAPHGGIFVFPTIGNVGGYCVALIAGAVIGAVVLGIIKRDVNDE